MCALIWGGAVVRMLSEEGLVAGRYPEYLQTGSDEVQFLHPARMRLPFRCEQSVQVNALVPLAAALGIGWIVKVGADADQAALVPIPDGGLVRRFERKAAAFVIDIVGTHVRGCLRGLDPAWAVGG
jgi:hypothetical protein